MSFTAERAPFIRDLQTGLLEEGKFLVRRSVLQTGKSQKPFLRLVLADATGHMPAIYFASTAELKRVAEIVRPGKVVRVQGIVEDFHGVRQIKLQRVELAAETDELSRFQARTPQNRRQMYAEMRQLISSIAANELREVCTLFLRDRAFMRLFIEAPASRQVHHAYIGGLMEHTLHVMQLVASFAKIFPHADRDLLIAGAFLHDIGKTEEYNFLFSHYDYSEAGRLKGHTLLGYEKLTEKLRLVKIHPLTRAKLEHVVLAHQGRRIWGAIEEPRFLEAYLVHAADAIDATQFIFHELRQNATSRNPDAVWSEYSQYLGREIFLR
ncbi:MAG: HD domain-containing protein [Turneriella sp.]|nr:HD domain-containing protein [Turneriella sp.]